MLAKLHACSVEKDMESLNGTVDKQISLPIVTSEVDQIRSLFVGRG